MISENDIPALDVRLTADKPQICAHLA